MYTHLHMHTHIDKHMTHRHRHKHRHRQIDRHRHKHLTCLLDIQSSCSSPTTHKKHNISIYVHHTVSLCQPVILGKASVVTNRHTHQAKHRSGPIPAKNSDNKTPSQLILNQQEITPYNTYYGICLLLHTHSYTQDCITIVWMQEYVLKQTDSIVINQFLLLSFLVEIRI